MTKSYLINTSVAALVSAFVFAGGISSANACWGPNKEFGGVDCGKNATSSTSSSQETQSTPSKQSSSNGGGTDGSSANNTRPPRHPVGDSYGSNDKSDRYPDRHPSRDTYDRYPDRHPSRDTYDRYPRYPRDVYVRYPDRHPTRVIIRGGGPYFPRDTYGDRGGVYHPNRDTSGGRDSWKDKSSKGGDWKESKGDWGGYGGKN
jgi:hypothetical protein